ncbi:MAG: BRO family protein [Streptococcus hyointestinalis]|uniref:BRO-N domain-containing protein n=1 Tax=Streptococcus hyointestinalis TaxID=1337 RepID=UPI0023F32508|nr:BRO family protein [Streptococcus hyointestinalis]MCI6872489.1 phage repressor protein [Streptococcus hyointestinalis]MDD7356363.1 BRO family protein [Streptococcus hyointestinalis]MDY4554108.1 BRO family protein [Streptococcus hyointestinalis]
MEHLQVISSSTFNGHPLNIYGDKQEPLFLARDVAEMIDYQKTSQGYYNTTKMLNLVDEDEKIKAPIPNRDSSQLVWFLTEQGLYEVLFQSRKSLAKEFKKVVKQVLKEIRLNGYYMQGELVPHAPQPRISVDAECDYLDRLAQALLDADNRADKLTEIRKMHAFASVMMGKVDFTRYTLSRVQK